jgi:hypothetical protein
VAAAALAVVVVLAWPDPPPARANIGCEVATAPAGAISEAAGAITGGAIGGGNPVGDACDSVTDGAVEAVTSPITGALKGIGNSIFSQITTWVTEGATWLIGQVVTEIEKSTTPELSSAGFLSEYARMAQIAAALAAASALLAILEAIAQSSWALLGRAFLVNLPLAFLATSVAFVVVQLLLVATDGMSHAIAAATQEHSRHFFHTAISDLSKAGGAAGGAVEGGVAGSGTKAGLQGASEVAVPVFVTFLVAIIGAFAAFFVWVELLMRDAAVYVVALFLPLAFAASIWPRWSGALRRTGELLVVVIGSKFVIVSIIALAAGLVSEEGADVEHILAASALMLLACFAPFMLFRLVPFAEGAMAAAYGRRSAGGVGGPMAVSSGAQMIRGRAQSNWAEPEVWSVKAGGGGGAAKAGPGGGEDARGPGGAGGPTPRPGVPGGGAVGGVGAGGVSGATGGAGGAGAGAAAPLAAVPVAAARSGPATAGRLADTGVARVAGGGSGGEVGGAGEDGGAPASRPAAGPASAPPRPPGEQPVRETAAPPPVPAEAPPRPPQDLPARPKSEESR